MSVSRVIVQLSIAAAGAMAVFVALPFMLREPKHSVPAPVPPPQRFVWFDTPPPVPEAMVETVYDSPSLSDTIPEETLSHESPAPSPPMSAIDLSTLPLASGVGVAVPVVPAIDLELVSVQLEGAAGNGQGFRIDVPARPLTPLLPVYPKNAERRGIEGSVIAEFTVGADGIPVDVIIVNATPAGVFEETARHAIRAWRLSPALRDGAPVPVRLRQTIRFISQRNNNGAFFSHRGTEAQRG